MRLWWESMGKEAIFPMIPSQRLRAQEGKQSRNAQFQSQSPESKKKVRYLSFLLWIMQVFIKLNRYDNVVGSVLLACVLFQSFLMDVKRLRWEVSKTLPKICIFLL